MEVVFKKTTEKYFLVFWLMSHSQKGKVETSVGNACAEKPMEVEAGVTAQVNPLGVCSQHQMCQ